MTFVSIFSRACIRLLHRKAVQSEAFVQQKIVLFGGFGDHKYHRCIRIQKCCLCVCICVKVLYFFEHASKVESNNWLSPKQLRNAAIPTLGSMCSVFALTSLDTCGACLILYIFPRSAGFWIWNIATCLLYIPSHFGDVRWEASAVGVLNEPSIHTCVQRGALVWDVSGHLWSTSIWFSFNTCLSQVVWVKNWNGKDRRF